MACIEALEWSMDCSSFGCFQRDFHSRADIEKRMVACCLEFAVVVGSGMGCSGRDDMETVLLPAFAAVALAFVE